MELFYWYFKFINIAKMMLFTARDAMGYVPQKGHVYIIREYQSNFVQTDAYITKFTRIWLFWMMRLNEDTPNI